MRRVSQEEFIHGHLGSLHVHSSNGVDTRSLPRLIAGAAMILVSWGAQTADILDTSASAGQLKTLIKAVHEAALADSLNGRGPFKVIAPLDEAFAKLPPGTLEALLNDTQKLSAVLAYHIAPAQVMAAQFKPGAVKSVQGQPLTATIQGGAAIIDSATIVSTDSVAATSAIHIIDAVVLPK
jgi:uncharacterized surface protein with fasciclin (FAS1) repeats